MATDRIESLWKFYDEHATQARQHEDQRERMTAVLVTLAGLLVGFLNADNQSAAYRLLGSGALTILGLGGFLFSLKHYERNRYHARILNEIRGEIDLCLSTQAATTPAGSIRTTAMRSLTAIRDAAEADHYTKHPEAPKCAQTKATSKIARHRTYLYWASAPLLVSLVGAIAFAITLYR